MPCGNWRQADDSADCKTPRAVPESELLGVAATLPDLAGFAAPGGGVVGARHPRLLAVWQQSTSGGGSRMADVVRPSRHARRDQRTRTIRALGYCLGGLMTQARRDILEMLAAGKITADEADRLM